MVHKNTHNKKECKYQWEQTIIKMNLQYLLMKYAEVLCYLYIEEAKNKHDFHYKDAALL